MKTIQWHYDDTFEEFERIPKPGEYLIPDYDEIDEATQPGDLTLMRNEKAVEANINDPKGWDQTTIYQVVNIKDYGWNEKEEKWWRERYNNPTDNFWRKMYGTETELLQKEKAEKNAEKDALICVKLVGDHGEDVGTFYLREATIEIEYIWTLSII